MPSRSGPSRQVSSPFHLAAFATAISAQGMCASRSRPRSDARLDSAALRARSHTRAGCGMIVRPQKTSGSACTAHAGVEGHRASHASLCVRARDDLALIRRRRCCHALRNMRRRRCAQRCLRSVSWQSGGRTRDLCALALLRIGNHWCMPMRAGRGCPGRRPECSRLEPARTARAEIEPLSHARMASLLVRELAGTSVDRKLPALIGCQTRCHAVRLAALPATTRRHERRTSLVRRDLELEMSLGVAYRQCCRAATRRAQPRKVPPQSWIRSRCQCLCA